MRWACEKCGLESRNQFELTRIFHTIPTAVGHGTVLTGFYRNFWNYSMSNTVAFKSSDKSLSKQHPDPPRYGMVWNIRASSFLSALKLQSPVYYKNVKKMGKAFFLRCNFHAYLCTGTANWGALIFSCFLARIFHTIPTAVGHGAVLTGFCWNFRRSNIDWAVCPILLLAESLNKSLSKRHPHQPRYCNGMKYLG